VTLAGRLVRVVVEVMLSPGLWMVAEALRGLSLPVQACSDGVTV
jgi:hypothetical protein